MRQRTGWQSWSYWGGAYLVGLCCLGATVVGRSVAEEPPKGKSAPPATAAERFDLEVREDLFAGFNGDEEALKRGIKLCEEVLQKDPRHAEAMVWLGAAKVYQAGQLFGRGQAAQAFPVWNQGLKLMDDAVALAPKKVGVRIPRAAVLMPASRSAPPAMAKPLLEKAKADFETIAELQKDQLGEIGTHPRGELLMGLADVYRLLGKTDDSQQKLQDVIRTMPGTKYAERAKTWLEAKPDAKLAHNCIGCHTPLAGR